MNKIKYSILTICAFISLLSNAQNEKTYRVNTIAFYNLENLFDPENDPDKYDEASPIMEMAESFVNQYLLQVMQIRISNMTCN